jgi:hypothetical protein
MKYIYYMLFDSNTYYIIQKLVYLNPLYTYIILIGKTKICCRLTGKSWIFDV